MMVRVARISVAITAAHVSMIASALANGQLGLTNRKVREGLVNCQNVARGVVSGLFGGFQLVVRDDIIARIDALSRGSTSA